MNKLEENWELYKLGIPWKDVGELEGDERDFLLKQAGEIREKMEAQQKQQEEAMKQQEQMRQAALAQQQQYQQGGMQGGASPLPPQGPAQQQPPNQNPFADAEKDERIAELEAKVASLEEG